MVDSRNKQCLRTKLQRLLFLYAQNFDICLWGNGGNLGKLYKTLQIPLNSKGRAGRAVLGQEDEQF